MPRTISIRDNNANFDLTIPDSLPEYYTDGMAQLLIGVPVCKVTFHTVVGHDPDGTQKRNANLQLAIPLTSLIEFAKNVLEATSHGKSNIAEGFQNYQDHFNTLSEQVAVAAPAMSPSGSAKRDTK